MRPLSQFAALATLVTAQATPARAAVPPTHRAPMAVADCATLATSTLRDVRIADPEAQRYLADVAAADCLTGPQRTAGAVSERSHLPCAYPQRALFDGKGSDAAASRFTCKR